MKLKYKLNYRKNDLKKPESTGLICKTRELGYEIVITS